ncbi:argininosuccinate synthase domain-containing protein [Bacteroidetes bacterium endosymbiont of Geopemphigus sp.]|uniref:argininosuccinate synthase domain-containing protein n=1 Tax=Bacteroidetes bacterium endosymbiont of Geopemphigus sp. TaxID=2047937 RepID=UPI000CD0647B|nr:argininosuccinate synthase domain-containing protein [Bacteroidetes bacterium endosymbiont of Geopemphigus sp.]
MKIEIRIAHADDVGQALSICRQIEESARIRKTGIAKRDPEYIKKKMVDGNAVIALCNGQIAGFSYIETFQGQEFVANSGMIVFPEFRQHGIAKLIKSEIFRLSREKFPKAKIFSITTSAPVLNMNMALGFKTVNFKHLTQSEDFWKGCKSCSNYDILTRNQRKMCLCSGLLYDPNEKKPKNKLLFGDKILLAYSGGLDTSYCLKYLINQGYEVHTAIVNTGGFNQQELRDIEQKAYAVGAKSHRSIEAKKDYYKRCIKYLIFGNVLRNNTYPLSVSAERIFQAIKIAEHANDIDARAIGHGSTGAGNDQVRFDLAFQIVCPDKLIISPIRDMKLSRKEEMDYLKDQGVDISWERARYSINKGLWGTSVGGAETLSSDRALPEASYPRVLMEKEPRKIQLEFNKGEFVALDGKRADPVENIVALEEIASRFAIGRDIHVGDTLIGIKGRVGFEAASAMIILKAHHLLEKHVLSKWQLYWKEQLGNWYGMLLHEAQYLDPVMRDIEAFLTKSQERVSGQVGVHLHPFRFELTGIESAFDMMCSQAAQYGETNRAWSAEEAKGFIKIFGNQMKIYHSLTPPNSD